MPENAARRGLRIGLLLVGIASVVAVYFYVRDQEAQLDALSAKSTFVPGAAANTNEPAPPIGEQPQPGMSSVQRELLALRSTLARRREETAQQSSVPADELTPEQAANLKALRRTFNRSLAGQYSRRQIHLTMQAVKAMLQDPANPGVVHDGQAQQPATLSWRVHLLPYIGEQQLYARFRLDEPWDSQHNQSLLAEMPMLYRGLYDKPDATVTRLMSLDTEDGFASGGRLRQLADVTDPHSDTLSLIIAGTKLAVPWTSPRDFEVTVAAFPAAMKLMPKPTYWVGTVEGAALDIHFAGSFETFRALVTVAGDEPGAVDAMIAEKFRLLKTQ